MAICWTAGCGIEHGLHLGGGDVFARSPDHVFPAVDEIYDPAFVLADDIAGMPPASTPAGLGRGVVIQIAGKKAAAGIFASQPNDQLAVRPSGDLAIVLVEDLGFQRRY